MRKYRGRSIALVSLALVLLCFACSRVNRQDTFRLNNGMTLKVVAGPILDSSVEVDSGQDRLLRGLEVTLSFRNMGTKPIKNSFVSSVGDDDDVWVTYKAGDETQRVGPEALRLDGGIGYRSTLRLGGIAIGGECVDSNPVSVYDQSGNHAGLVVLICTKPGESDSVTFMFPRPRRPSEATLTIGKCDGCPTEGIKVPLGQRVP